MKKIWFYSFFFLLVALLNVQFCLAQNLSAGKAGNTIDKRVDSVLKLMTLEEKVGQMNQYNGDWAVTGPITKDGELKYDWEAGDFEIMIGGSSADVKKAKILGIK